MASILSIWMICLVGCAAAGAKTIPLTIRGHELEVELAITEAEQVRGLMYRKEMGKNHGMLFVYDSPRQVAYWMKNTYLPLSIAFLDSSRRIINMADMVPLNEHRTYPSQGPCQYVIEVNQGWFAEHGVKVGDQVEFTLPKKAR